MSVTRFTPRLPGISILLPCAGPQRSTKEFCQRFNRSLCLEPVPQMYHAVSFNLLRSVNDLPDCVSFTTSVPVGKRRGGCTERSTNSGNHAALTQKVVIKITLPLLPLSLLKNKGINCGGAALLSVLSRE